MSSKFDTPAHEYLYQLTLDGTYPDSGHVESPTGWFSAVTVDPDHTLDELPAGLTQAPIGHHLVRQDNQGFVYVETFDTEAARDEAYAKLEEEYGDWEDS